MMQLHKHVIPEECGEMFAGGAGARKATPLE
jgi:hypothetical protein